MLDIYQFLVTAEVVTAMEVDDHCGAALRGTLFEAVWTRFCTNKQAASCAECRLHPVCPVSALVSPLREVGDCKLRKELTQDSPLVGDCKLREERSRWRDVPRPYIIYPPLGASRRYERGETLQFGFSLFGSIIRYFPYLILSLNLVEENGMGRKLAEHRGRRGRFKIKCIESFNALTGERSIIYEQGKPYVTVSTLAITVADVSARAALLSPEHMTLDFLTAARIIERDAPLSQAPFAALTIRLLERLSALEEAYGLPDERWVAASKYQLVGQARTVTCIDDKRQWEEVRSYSFRQRRGMDISGFVGQATFVGDLTPFRELLVWGELVRVGKGAVKGNGWYKIAG